MATVNLHPGSSVVSGSNWDIIGGGTLHSSLADSDDATLIRNDTQNETVIFLLDDLHASLSGVTITSVRFYVRGVLYNTRSGNTDIQVILTDASDTTYYAETVTLNFTGGYAPEDHYGTARTTDASLGGDEWKDGDLDGLRLNINTSPEDPAGSSYAQVSKAYIEVTYTEAVTDNAVFFGCNF